VVNLDPEAKRGTKVVEVSLPPDVKRAARQQQPRTTGLGVRSRLSTFKQLELQESGVSRGIDESMKAIRLFYARLHRLDRWNVWVLLGAFLASFLPWSYVQGQGLVAGIQEYGVASAAAALLTFLAIYLRTNRRRISGSLLMLQLVLASGLAAVPVYRLVISTNEQLSVGLYLTAATAAGVVLLSLARLARINA
jgi:hypothetical protein